MIPRTREALTQLLARTFPTHEDIDAETVDAFVDALMRAKKRTHAADLEATTPPASYHGDGSLIYKVRATHARRTPVTSVFTGETEMARVALGRDQPLSYTTSIGKILPEDHLLPTVGAVREKFDERIGRPFERVDLVAPGRSTGVRFASMSLYLGYEKVDSPVPFFVIFEPGSATGKAMALYLAPTIDSVVDEQAGYAPTPFAAATHWYRGGLRLAPNGRDPEVLYMRASVEREDEPYLRLHAEYSVARETPFVFPAEDLVEAAMRVLAIQKSLGHKQGLIERLIADVGLFALPWVDRPDNAAREGQCPGPREQEPLPACVEFDPFLAQLSPPERDALQASIGLLLSEVVRADGRFDRLERIEVDWTMNFEVPSALGDAFRFSPAAEREYRALFEGKLPTHADARPFDERLAEVAAVVRRLPPALHDRYTSFVTNVCRSAAESSGGFLWFGARVSAAERTVLERIARALELGASEQSGGLGDQ